MKKNINDIREILCEEIDNLRAGKTNAANVNAIVNASGKILTTVKMEMEYSKLVGRKPDSYFIDGKNKLIDEQSKDEKKVEKKKK